MLGEGSCVTNSTPTEVLTWPTVAGKELQCVQTVLKVYIAFY